MNEEGTTEKEMRVAKFCQLCYAIEIKIKPYKQIPLFI